MGFLAAGLGLLALAGLAGAATAAREAGDLPPTERLALLTPRASSASDLIRILGEPRGKGTLQLNSGEGRRNVWIYDYRPTPEVPTPLRILLVFMDEDIYDGHLWFSTADMPHAPR